MGEKERTEINHPEKLSRALRSASDAGKHLDTDVTGSIYDDVLRTICERHIRFLIPLVNRCFGTAYTDAADIRLLSNEHHGAVGSRLYLKVTDAYFSITQDGITHTYHLECQSDGDASMVVRIMEYDLMSPAALELARSDIGRMPSWSRQAT